MDHRDEIDHDDEDDGLDRRAFLAGECEVCGRISTVSVLGENGVKFEFCELHWGMHLGENKNSGDKTGYQCAFRSHSLDLDPDVCDMLYGESPYGDEEGLGE